MSGYVSEEETWKQFIIGWTEVFPGFKETTRDAEIGIKALERNHEALKRKPPRRAWRNRGRRDRGRRHR